jgi:hypothetical protein
VRLPGPIALSVAINLIDTLVGAGRIKTTGLTEMISKIVSTHARENEEQPSD